MSSELAPAIPLTLDQGSEQSTHNMRVNPKLRKLMAVGAALILLTACSNDNEGDATPNTPSITHDDSNAESPQPQNDCEGDQFCYTSSADMKQAYTDTIQYVAPFFKETYKTQPTPEHYYFIADSDGAVDTPCGTVTSENLAQYCVLNDSIYLGESTMWNLYHTKGAGDAGLALALAHESGHMVQSTVGVPEPVTDRETIVHEDQADCIAGAWASWANDKGMLKEKDIDEFFTTLDVIASTEGAQRDHGTLDERVESFSLGVTNGLEYCNDYYHDHPLITHS